NVFPFHRERALVIRVVQRADDALEVDRAATERTEFPEAPRVAEFGVTAEHTRLGRRAGPINILHMDVIDAVGELADERDVIHALIAEVRGIVIETKLRPAADRFQRALRAHDVEGD